MEVGWVAGTQSCDVVVIGGGSAAYEAAVSAVVHGARNVVMLEKAPEDQFGGNARFSGTGFRFTFEPDEIPEICDLSPEAAKEISVEPYPPEMFLADLNRVTQGRIDQQLAQALIDDSNAAIRWAKEMGLRWGLGSGVVVDGIRHFSPGIPIRPVKLPQAATHGLSQLLQWRSIADRLGVQMRFRSKVIGILGSEAAVTGVRVLGADGQYELHAPSVIACSGGFQANPEMRARYLGANADLMKVRGSRHDTGEVLQMLLALGAQPAGQWQGAHVSPIDADAPAVESGFPARRYAYCWGITVNEYGQRFINEGEAQISYTYAKTGWAILREPGGLAYQLFDAAAKDLARAEFLPTDLVQADSVTALAEQIGLSPVVLNRTVEDFNAAIDKDIVFDPTIRDGRRTYGLSPDKTNWARAIATPPFYAVAATGGITFTFGGVKINPDANVLATGGAPIPGLYAAGDIIGLFFHNYPSMTGQTRNLVFGRRAGAHAAARAAR